MKYRPELDALRVVAFLGVFAFHSMSREASFYPAFGALAFVALPNLPLSVLARYPLMALACMGIVAAVLGLRVPGIVARLGRLTYGLYVVHLFALSAVGVYVKPLLVGVPGAYWLALVLAFALSVALAAASYAAIERPFLRLKARYSSNG